MLLLDLILVLVVAVVLITTVISIGAPVANMLANKAKFKFDALGSEAEQVLKKRVASLEEEVRELRGQINEVREAADFAVRMIESSETETPRRLAIKESSEEKRA